MTELAFFVQGHTAAAPRSDDELRDALRDGQVSAETPVRVASSQLFLPCRAWAALGLPAGDLPAPPLDRAAEVAKAVSPDLLLAPSEVLDMIRYAVFEHDIVYGPVTGHQLREAFDGGRYRTAMLAPLGTTDWVAARRLFDRTLTDSARAIASARPSSPTSALAERKATCPICRELIPSRCEVCPECDEPILASVAASGRAGSIPDDPEDASWLRMHWRPILTMGVIMSLLLSGITLRYLAPDRFPLEEQRPAGAMPAPAAPTACSDACWTGEACQVGTCVWQQPNGVGHVSARPNVAGPFALPTDATDVVLLDAERFAVGLLGGTEVRSTRTGQALGIVSEATQSRRLVPVESALYAIGPQHIAVLDKKTMRLLKTLEMGAIIGDVEVGVGGRRALVSLPGAHAVAILSTELHVELDRIRFGDDATGPVAIDDNGTRALTTTGSVPLAGLSDPQGGAVYAFDPSRLATQQDRVRAAMLGNPVDSAMSPDGRTSFVVLRQANKVVPLDWLASGTIHRREALTTCDQPEQIEIIRKGRRAVVRCNRGRALQVLDLQNGKLLSTIPFNAPVTDMVVSPDAEQVVVALPSTGDGALGLVDLATFSVELIPLTEPATRVRISPDGQAVLALSERSKVAWVLR
ncbi:MAG: hypothetical protein U0271_14150 [Polyangiaceae bacterium]